MRGGKRRDRYEFACDGSSKQIRGRAVGIHLLYGGNEQGGGVSYYTGRKAVSSQKVWQVVGTPKKPGDAENMPGKRGDCEGIRAVQIVLWKLRGRNRGPSMVEGDEIGKDRHTDNVGIG
jgi:hypothetical protein